MMEYNDIIALFVDIVENAVPFAVVFTLGNILVNTFLRMAFGGKIEFK